MLVCSCDFSTERYLLLTEKSDQCVRNHLVIIKLFSVGEVPNVHNF